MWDRATDLKKKEGKGPEKRVVLQEKSLQIGAVANKTFTKQAHKQIVVCKLNTTCSWFSNNKLLEAIPIHSSCNLYIRTFSHEASCNAWWKKHKNFYVQINTQKVFRGKLSPYTRIKHFFHTCLKTRKHGIQDQILGTTAFGDAQRLILYYFIFVAYRMCILRFICSFCPKMKSEPSIQSTLWIKNA